MTLRPWIGVVLLATLHSTALAAERARLPTLLSKACNDTEVKAQTARGEPVQFRIGSTPFSHATMPARVVVDPRGEWLLSESGASVRMFDLRTGALVGRLRASFHAVEPATGSRLGSTNFPCIVDIGFSTDGGMLFAADVEGITLWRRGSLEPARFVSLPVLPVGDPPMLPEPYTVRYAVSADARWIAVAKPNRTSDARENAARRGASPADVGGSDVVVIDTKAGEPVWTEKLPFVVTAVAFSASGVKLAVAGPRFPGRPEGAQLGLLSVQGVREAKAIDLGRFSMPQSIAVDRDDAEAVVFGKPLQSYGGMLVRVRLRDGTIVQQSEPRTSHPASALLEHSDWIGASGDGKTVIVPVAIDRRWGVAEFGLVPMDVATGESRIALDPLAFGAETVVPHPRGRSLVVWPTNYRQDAVIVDLAATRFVGTLPQSAARKALAAFHPDGQTLYAVIYDASARSSLVAWDVRDAPRRLRSIPLNGETSELTVSRDGKWIALDTQKAPYQGMLDAGGVIEVRNAETFDVVLVTEPPARVERRQLFGLQFAPDANALWATESWDVISGVESSRRRVSKVHRIAVPDWKSETYERTGVPTWPLWVVRDGTIVELVVDRGQRFALVTPRTGERSVFPAPEGYVEPLDRSPSGRSIVYRSNDSVLRVLDAMTQAPATELAAAECTNLRSARFSRDESMLFAACGNGSVLGWSLARAAIAR